MRRGVRWAPVTVQEVPSPTVAGGHVDDSPGEEDDAADTDNEWTILSSTTVDGDSVYNSGDEDAADGAAVAADGAAVAADGAAVAADGDGAPQQVAQVRRPRDTAPKPDAAYDRDAPGKWDLRNSAEHVGNIGWLFGNWGLLPRAAPMRAHIETVLKKNPDKVQTHAVAC